MEKKDYKLEIVVDCHMRYCGSKHFCTLSHFSLFFLEYYGKLLCSYKQKNDHIEYTRKINK